jgi:primary-amine oxidase
MTAVDAHARTGHPLDPLAPAEISAAVEVLRAAGHLGARALINTVLLAEPPKDVVRRHVPGAASPRTAIVTWVDRARDGATFRARVALTDRTATEPERITEGHAGLMLAEQQEVQDLVKRHPDVIAALARRGITDLDTVEIGIFPAGNVPFDNPGGLRIARTTCWMDDERYPAYTGPVEGLLTVVDLAEPRVLEVVDNGIVEMPPPPAPRPATGARAQALKPLVITQPEGPSFTVDGHHIDWQGWQLRVGFNAREGLTLHTLSFLDRPVVYRASFAEMVVPYGDPNVNHAHRSVFDFGEANIGLYANHLTLGCDCLGVIKYLDAAVNDERGDAKVLENAICIHEEDYGVLYKHTDGAGNREVVRSRRLVVSWFATLDNYDYGFYWYLYQDGRIECEVKLTGIVLVSSHPGDERPEYGELVAPGLNGMVHQHIFNVRLDMEVDGPENSVVELEYEPVPMGEGNALGNAFRTRETVLRTESEAQRSIDPLHARHWKIINPGRRNALGKPVGYRLQPGDNVGLAIDPGSKAAARAGFARSHLWVTRHADDELYAAGDFPNLHAGGAGLPAYAARDRSIEGEDLVVWYTFSHHHVPRPEDWPVMPVATVGFELKPSGFFDRNPALDLPAPSHCHTASVEVR